MPPIAPKPHGEPPASFVPSRLSDAIAVARVLCIFGLVYAHAWTGLGGSQLAAMSQTPQGVLRWTLMEMFGRSAVPLLGMISGWLVAGSTRKRSYRAFVANKAQTILLPMVLWNAASIVLVSGCAWLGFIKAPVPHHLSWLLNEIFCAVAPDDINVQTAFLRDLFLCMLVAPGLLRLPRSWLLVVLAAALTWVTAGWTYPILLRPQILLFFVIGILARRTRLPERIVAMPLTWPVCLFALLMPLKVWLSVRNLYLDTHWFALLDVLSRLVMGFMFWRVAWRLAASPDLFRRIEPYAFLMFCAHVIMMWLGGPAFAWLAGPLGSPGYPLLFLVMPVLVLGITMVLGHILVVVAPAAAEVLSGGRLKRTPRYQAHPAESGSSTP